MTKLGRKHLKVFGSNAASNEIGQFGSAIAGAKLETADIEEIQALGAWLAGWSEAAISGNRYPTLQERNAVDKVFSYQAAYLLQEGIPEYSTQATYYIGSIAKKAGTFELYGSIVDDNVGNVLTDATKWQFLVDLTKIAPVYDVPFALNSGNVDSGEADILSYSGTTLSFKVDDGTTYKPLVVTYADKSQETHTSIANITGLSTNGTYTILKEKGSNPVAVLSSGISGGTAISGGDYAGYPVANAFDNNLSTKWASSQTGSGVNGVSYIGKNLLSSKTINTIKLTQSSTALDTVSSVKVQSSTNGSSWTDVQTFNALSVDVNLLILSSPLTTQYVRLLANSGAGTSATWDVNELTFNQNQVTQGKTFPLYPIDGDYHCLTATGLQTYKRVDGAWVETQYVPVGKVDVVGNVISAVSTNSYNQNGYDTSNAVIPNYAKGISLTYPLVGNKYTAPYDGVYITSYSSTAAQAQRLIINGVETSIGSGSNNSYPAYITHTIQLNKGDVIYWAFGYTTMWTSMFYPMKGVS